MREVSLSGLRGKFLRSRLRRVREEEALLKKYVRRITATFPKCAVLLFGSRAKGEHLPYSDYDLTVVLNEVKDKVSLIEILRRLKPRGLPLDLIVIEKEELSDPLIKKMLEGSKTLHDGLNVSRLIK